ncbi:hypothetical protein ELQ39_15835 [Streptomyces sp. GB4-14]|uniref:hypothetical protein n=1 Tax=Streptomyces sp. GB4-14 TaxID=2498703 RepID=UPI001F5EDF6B|nr:hypothetical protein [Streptomyces sp. GB4-14]
MSELSRKMFLAETAAVREHLAEQAQQATAEANPAVSSAGQAPATNHDLRDRIAAAIWERQNPGRRWADCEYRWRADAEEDADAVLAVLPAPTDRAVTLRWAADQIDAETQQAKAGGVLEPHKFRPCRDASAQLRRLADETATETPAAAYSDGNGPAYCIGCAPAVGADVPLTADDVGPSDRCRSCGRHVVDVAAAGARQDEGQQP